MEYTVSDMMVVSLSREIRERETVFHGVASPIPMVAIMLARALKGDSITYVNIAGGVNAKPKNLKFSTDGPNMLEGSGCLFGLTDIFDLSMRGKLDVAFLSGVQIDRQGNLNSSVIGEYDKPKVRLPGGAGSAVILPTAKRILVWRTKHNKKAFVEKVDFISAQGNVDTVVTPYCVFKKKENVLVLESVHPFSSIKEVKENTDFAINGDDFPSTVPPSDEELSMLNLIDPLRIRDIEMA